MDFRLNLALGGGLYTKLSNTCNFGSHPSRIIITFMNLKSNHHKNLHVSQNKDLANNGSFSWQQCWSLSQGELRSVPDFVHNLSRLEVHYSIVNSVDFRFDNGAGRVSV